MFNYVARKMTALLINNQLIESEEYSIYHYGFEIFIYFITNTVIALLIGGIYHQFLETIIFLGCYCTLRQFSGGYHAKNYLKCSLTFIGVLLMTIYASRCLDLESVKYLKFCCLLLSLTTIYKLAPLENENKPLNHLEKIKYKKTAIKVSLYLSGIITILMSFNLLPTYTFYAWSAMIWTGILLIMGKCLN